MCEAARVPPTPAGGRPPFFYTTPPHKKPPSPSLSTTGVCSATATQTLTNATGIPAVGYAETRTYYNSSSANGWALTGTGNTWDATSVTPFGITAISTYRAPGSSPFAGTYPGTTLCAERVQNGNTEWRHYIVDAAHAEMILSLIHISEPTSPY